MFETRLVFPSRPLSNLAGLLVSDPPGASYPITEPLPSPLALGREASVPIWAALPLGTIPCALRVWLLSL